MSRTKLDSHTNHIRHIPKPAPWGALAIPTVLDLSYWLHLLYDDLHKWHALHATVYYWAGCCWEMFGDAYHFASDTYFPEDHMYRPRVTIATPSAEATAWTRLLMLKRPFDPHTWNIHHAPTNPPWRLQRTATTARLKNWYLTWEAELRWAYLLQEWKYLWTGNAWKCFCDLENKGNPPAQYVPDAGMYIPFVPVNVARFYEDWCNGVPRKTKMDS